MAFRKVAFSFIISISLVFSLVGGIIPAHATASLPLSGKVIILDAGHGTGSDNRVGLYSEHTAMLGLARRIKSILEAEGATVFMTRDSDATVPLQTSCAIINIHALEAVRKTRSNASEIAEIDRLIGLMRGIINNPVAEGQRLMNFPYNVARTIHPDLQRIFEFQKDPVVRDNFLMISLHSNAATSVSVRGAEAYYISPAEYTSTRTYYPGYSYSELSKSFGNIVLNHIHNTGIPRRARGVVAQNYVIIREHNVPAVLVENGFHTNDTDRNLLLNPSFMNSLAVAYLYSIAQYFNSSISSAPSLPQSIFSDVSVSSVAFNAITWAHAGGLITGSGGRFYPDDSLSRSAFALILHRYAGSPQPVTAGGAFSDVSRTNVAYTAITWAHENGIVTGSGGRFYPDDSVTREAMVLMLYRYHARSGGDTVSNSDALNTFSDRSSISPVATDAVRWGISHGLITGSGGRVYPVDTATRSASVLVLFRYNNLFGGDDKTWPDTPITPPSTTPSTPPSAPATPPSSQTVFSDVPVVSVAYDAIIWAQKGGLITGSGGRFYPNDSLSRSAFALILHRYAGSPQPDGAGGAFSDVSRSNVAFTAITWAHENGIVTGAGGRFYPDDPVTREAMSLMLYRYHDKIEREITSRSDALDVFADRSSISPVATEAMRWAISNELLTGSGGRLYPIDVATRSASVLVLYRYNNMFNAS